MKAAIVLVLAVLAWLFIKGSQASSGAQGGTASDYPGGTGMQGGTGIIANGIATFEGFFKSGSLASRSHNPGDIGTYNGKVRTYADDASGFGALNDYINSHATANPSWDFYDFFRYYLTGDTQGTAGPGQDPDAYAEFVASQAGVDPTTPMFQVIG